MADMPSNVPIPDPSVLTTEQLRRELGALRDIIETRLDAMDRSTSVFTENLQRVPTDVDKQVGNLRDLHEQKFIGVERQFVERDVRSAGAQTAAQLAVNAALSAQKEAAATQNDAAAAAISKSEIATAKQIDSILALMASNTRAIDDKIASINGRLDRGEGGQRQESSSQSTIIAIAAVVVSLGIGLLAIFNERTPAASAPQLLYQQPTQGGAPAIIQVPK